MTDTVLSVATRAVLEACERLGLDGDRLLEVAGLTREQVNDSDARLPAAAADALWQAAYAGANDPLLALHAAEALQFGAYKVVDFVAAHSPTLGDAFERVARYFALVDPRAVLEIHASGSERILCARARDAGVSLPAPAQEYTLTALVTRLRAVAGPSFHLARVEFAFTPIAGSEEYRRVLGAEVRFGCPAPCLVFTRAAWDAPIQGADASLLSVLDDHARRLLSELPRREGWASRAREVLVAELNGGEPTMARVARRLGLSERTLQRKLQAEEQSLATLLDEVRSSLARAHLSDPKLSLAEIAWLLGFSDQSAFTRAFRRWTGTSPGAFRSALS